MRARSNHTLAAVVVLSVAVPLGASGLRNFELGARAAGLGGAFVARADDVSAVFYNPAALPFLPGLRLKINIQNLRQSLTARAAGTESATTFQVAPVRTAAFFSYTFGNRFSLGLGAFPSQAIDVQWPDYWPFNMDICRNKFSVFTLRGVAALKVLDSLSLGASLDYLDARNDWAWNNPGLASDEFPYYFGRNSLVGLKGSGWTFALGLFYTPSSALRLGVRYQHGASLSLKGEHFLAGIGVQKASLSVDLPAEVTAGIQVAPLAKLRLQLDAQWTDWSRASPWILGLGDQISGMWGAVMEEQDIAFPSRWHDTVGLLCGAEYALSSVIFLRAGFSRLPAAVSLDNLHPFAPDLDDRVFSLGAGYEGPFFSITSAERLGDMSVDVFVQYHDFRDGVSKLPGLPLAYSSSRWVIGAGIGFIY